MAVKPFRPVSAPTPVINTPASIRFIMQKRLFIISNRLPLTIQKHGGQYTCRPSSGGLISAVSAYLNNSGKADFYERIWAGVPGCSESVWSEVMGSKDQTEYAFLPVFVDWKKYELYYNGFANSLIWPLFHYFPSFADYNAAFYEAYLAVNRRFAEVLQIQVRKDDIVWIHDYHLLPLAGMLREKIPGLTIGFFLHIPFPSYELFRVMPKRWQYELLRGMLGADLLGFQTVDDTLHFLTSVEKVLHIENDGQYVTWQNREVKADAFPISIDYQLFDRAYDDALVSKARKEYLALKGSKKMIFSVDRLDYTKGLTNRLKAYKQFLSTYPEYHGKVVFTLIIVPSRDAISKYAERKKMIDEFIGNINSSLGTITWQPVIYQYGHLKFAELIALYTACDLALITPIRDGMNLVSKEFIASRKDQQGVLVLSEMAGAANELSEALLINPNDLEELVTMIKVGLEMSSEEQLQRMSNMQQRIQKYDVNEWATDFFGQLKAVKAGQLEFEVKFLDNFAQADLYRSFARSHQRLFLLDYDGTLAPFASRPGKAAPDKKLLDILERLSSDPSNDVYVISGRDSETLTRWLGHLPIGLVAEHGAKYRVQGGYWQNRLIADNENWISRAETVMDKYVARCPNTFIEKKEFSVAWHYRNADLLLGGIRAKQLLHELRNQADQTLDVLDGNKVIEVRNKGVNKGIAVSELVAQKDYDFVLCVGDDKTDEDMFIALARIPEAITIKVGPEASYAKYNLHTPYLVQSLLQALSLYPQPVT